MDVSLDYVWLILHTDAERRPLRYLEAPTAFDSVV